MLAPATQTENQVTKPTATNGSFFGGGGSAPFFQAKLTVNQPGDEHEHEADAVADQVMRMQPGDAPMVQRMPIPPVSSVQRACASCDKEKEGIQRKESGGGDAGGKAAPSVVSNVLSSGGGQPMEGGTRQFLESRFGQDFSQVRIHTDTRAAESASAIQARAYTSGQDVVFGSGEYQPGSERGRRLLAHELVHVGQQGGAKRMVLRQAAPARDLASSRFAQNPVLESVYDGRRILRLGDSGTAVTLVQESLVAQGYALPRFGADGSFGNETKAAVILFQTDSGAGGLDGIIGPETLRLLDMHDLGATLSRGPASLPLPAGAPASPPATAAAFSEEPAEQFAGYDNSTATDWLVVPLGGRRRAVLTITPANARPSVTSSNPAIATVANYAGGIVITGVSAGTTDIFVREGWNLARLRIVVKAQRQLTVDFHFMRDNAVPPHQTTRTVASAPSLTSTLNRIWERQANVRFRRGIVDTPTVPFNLGPSVVAATAAAIEWVRVIAFRTAGNYNVFLVWEYEPTGALGDTANAGTANWDTLLEDNECGDALSVAHEVGHSFGLALGGAHPANTIMSGCPGADRRRVTKAQADIANP